MLLEIAGIVFITLAYKYDAMREVSSALVFVKLTIHSK